MLEVKKIAMVALAAISLALIATVATAAYATNMMAQQSSGTTYQMSRSQCQNQMQGTSMETMHNSGYHNSMMGNYTQGGMMGSDNYMGASGMGSGGCH